MARLVSKIYGEALFDFAKEHNQLEKMYEEAQDIILVWSSSSELNDFLANPKISTDNKIKFVNELFTNKVWAGPIAKVLRLFKIDINKGDNPKILDFISIVIKKGRTKEIVNILKYFSHLTLRSKNIGEAEVTSAHELSDEKKKVLEDKLVSSTNFNEFIVDYKIDESLIAGIKIKIDDKVLDKTYKTKMFDLTKSLRGLKL